MIGSKILDSTGHRLSSSQTAAKAQRDPTDSEVADLLLVLDASARIREISPSVRRNLGYSRGELLGSDFCRLLHADDVILVRSLLQGDQRPLQADLRIRHQSDSWRRFSIDARMAPGPDRQTLLIVEGRDISEHDLELLVTRPTMLSGGASAQGSDEPQSPEEPLSPDLIERARAQSETVLVALDDGRVSTQVCGIMRQLGYSVLEASSPADAEGFARVHQGTIHLLVTDLATPRVRGGAFVHAMQAIRPGLKSLLVSRQGYGSLAERRVHESGACLLHHPFTQEELAHALRRAIEGSQE